MYQQEWARVFPFIGIFSFPHHSRASKVLIRNQSLFMGPLQGQRAMLGGPEFLFGGILANGGGQEKSKNWNDISCSEFQTDHDALFTTSML